MILAGAATACVAAFVLLWSPEPDYSKINVATTTDLQRELGALGERLDIPGMSAAIAEGDRVVLQLADEGRLDLDSPVSTFGVEIASDEPIRVWHLLSHTSARTPGRAYRYDARAFGELTAVVERATGVVSPAVSGPVARVALRAGVREFVAAGQDP